MSQRRTSKLTIIFDLETTGFSPFPLFSDYHKIIQICAKCIETNAVFNEFVNPGFNDIPPKSVQTHNITIKDVKNAFPINNVLERMLRFFAIEKYDTVYMVAHNCYAFDQIILLKEDVGGIIPPNVVFWDTLPWLRKNIPNMESYSLENLYKSFYGEAFKNSHRADADVMALERIFKDHIVQIHEEDGDRLNNVLCNIRFIGPWRASQLFKKANVTDIKQLITFAHSFNDKKGFDAWLRNALNMRNVSQRFFAVSVVFGVDLWDKQLWDYINIEGKEDCINSVDYYVKYKYVLALPPPCKLEYQKGLREILINLS